MNWAGTVLCSFIGTGVLILFGIVRCQLAVGQLHANDVANWGELSDAEEAEAEALGGRLIRLLWSMGITALGVLIWAERDRLAELTSNWGG